MSLKSQNEDSDKLKKYSLEEYFELESQSEMRHEYHDGYIIPVISATENHGRIVSNMVFLLQSCLRDTECDVFASDRPVYTKACNRVFYPDVMSVCGERKYYEYSKNVRATINPSVLIEVISESTQHTDRSIKLRCYRRFLSLKQYVIIEQDFIFIEIYEQDATGRWTSKIYDDENDKILLDNCVISVKEVYHKVELTEPDSASD